jgi:hypothetical protein
MMPYDFFFSNLVQFHLNFILQRLKDLSDSQFTSLYYFSIYFVLYYRRERSFSYLSTLVLIDFVPAIILDDLTNSISLKV